MTTGKLLCLNMIVKNEMANLERCLGSIVEHIGCWVVCDTGSTDGTQDFIKSFFGKRNVPGELHSYPFENFEQARNTALDYAAASLLPYDYLLLADADMELVVEDQGFRERLEGPGYRLMQRTAGMLYWNTRLVRRNSGARYHGATHEYLAVPEDVKDLKGLWYKDHASGSNRTDKFQRDIQLLIEGLKEEPNNVRYWFYLAQSYRDAGLTAEAAETYAKRAEMGGWDEEAWQARLQQARCLLKLGDEGGFLRASLAAFNQRPQRAESLYDLARFYRERGMNDASVLFSEPGLALPLPQGDILFVEDFVYTAGLKEEYSIAANYSRDPKRKDRGFAACNWLALNRNVPDGSRELAFSNLVFYFRSAHEMMPSFKSSPIGFTPPDGYFPSNPSVARRENDILLVQRTVNYTVEEVGLKYSTPNAAPVHTRNFLLSLTADLNIKSAREIRAPANMPKPCFTGVQGFEDMRLFSWKDQLWCSACVRELTPEGWCEQVLARIDESDDSSCQLTDWRVLTPEGARMHEKNWMPRVKGEVLHFIHTCDPTRVINEQARTVATTTPLIAAKTFRGGTQAIEFDEGWLALVHEVLWSPPEQRRYYFHRFVWFNTNDNLQAVTRPFFFQRKGIEYAVGLAWHPDAERMIISYGVGDGESWLATVAAKEVQLLLEDVEQLSFGAPQSELNSVSCRPRASLARVPRNEPLSSKRLQFMNDAGGRERAEMPVASNIARTVKARSVESLAAEATRDEETWYALWQQSRRLRNLDDGKGFEEAALEAFRLQPYRAEPLHDLARYHLEKLRRDYAALFAEAGMTLPCPPEGSMGLERNVYESGLKEAFTIAANYSTSSARYERGLRVCNWLALSREGLDSVRALARYNLRWYVEPAQALMKSLELRPLAIDAPSGFKAGSVSVLRDKNGFILAVRAVNFTLLENGAYDLHGDTSFRSRVLLLNLDRDFAITSAAEVHEPENMPVPQHDKYRGFEDPRLFQWRDDLWCICSVCELSTDGRSQMILARIDRSVPDRFAFNDWRVLVSGVTPRWEKNWMPQVIGDELRFVYSLDPMRIITEAGKIVHHEVPAIAAENFKGGSQVVPFDGGWLMLIHEWEPVGGWRQYLHRFVWLDAQYQLRRVSRRFFFKRVACEFASGLAWHVDEERLVISFAVDEREPHLACVEADDVRAVLLDVDAHRRESEESVAMGRPFWRALGGQGVPAPWSAVPSPSARHPLSQPRNESPVTNQLLGYSSSDILGDPARAVWVTAQTNRALRDDQALDEASAASVAAGLPLHTDAPKAWDNFLAIFHTAATTEPDVPVLDAGAGRQSAYLPGLRKLGFSDLTGINLSEREAEIVDGICYCFGDITNTNFEAGYFGFVACLSVIEHGVDSWLFFKEMARILRPGGRLFVSMDYWQDAIDVGDRTAFGVPVKIFTSNEVTSLVERASRVGLTLVGDLDLACDQKVVRCDGLYYTFCNLFFRKLPNN